MTTFKDATKAIVTISNHHFDNMDVTIDGGAARARGILKDVFGLSARRAGKSIDNVDGEVIARYGYVKEDDEYEELRAKASACRSLTGVTVTVNGKPITNGHVVKADHMSLGEVTGGSDNGKSFGWLIFWTLANNIYEVKSVVDSATRAGVPDWVIKRAVGKTASSAFTKAANLGAAGTPSMYDADEPVGSMARYLTREVRTIGSEKTYVLIRELTDSANVRIATTNIGALSVSETGVVSFVESPEAYGLSSQIRSEYLGLVDRIKTSTANYLGAMDSNKIRAMVIGWLRANNRVTVRGTGGVYYVPTPRMANGLAEEIKAMTEWVNSEDIGGVFSSIQLYRGDTTTADTFVNATRDEIMGEIEDATKRLAKWEASDKMNAGSKAYSAHTVLEKVTSLKERLATASLALEEKFGTVEASLEIVRARADRLFEQQRSMIERAKSPLFGTPQDVAVKEGKTGTAKRRAAKRRL